MLVSSLTLLGFTKANQAANYYFWLRGLQGTISGAGNSGYSNYDLNCRSYDFENVQFSYPLAPDNRVLKGVSLSVS